MTIDPTALQTARLHTGHIRLAWPMLGDARTARVTRPTVALSGRAAASRDADLRAERTDRDATQSYRALATTPAPANLTVIDAEIETLATIGSTCWAIRSDLRQWSKLVPIVPAGVPEKLTWLTTMLDRVSAHVVDQAATDLRHAAGQLTRALGLSLEDHWHPSGRRCPACGLRALSAWTESPDPREWTIECRGEIAEDDKTRPCRCAGDDCPCARPGGRPKTRHLWPA